MPKEKINMAEAMRRSELKVGVKVDTSAPCYSWRKYGEIIDVDKERQLATVYFEQYGQREIYHLRRLFKIA